MGRTARCSLAALACALLALAPAARAADPTPDARKLAARYFSEAERAYAAEDWTHAAEAFEAAYRAAPHPDPLWNAARAWQRAGEPARAANLYARYLREAPGNAPDRASAQRALAQLGRKLARIDVHAAAGVEELRVDGKSVEGDSVYVIPGTHALSGRQGERVVEQTATVAPGAVVSVALAPSEPAPLMPAGPSASPAPPPAPPPSASPTSTSQPPASPPPASPPPAPVADVATPRAPGKWSPVVVYVGAAATVAAAGVVVWSGLDTLAARRDWEAAPTHTKLEAGRGKEVRTNVITGVAIGFGALTVAAALFLVDWRAGGAKVALGPTGATLGGSF